MRSYGRGFVTAVDPYTHTGPPDEDGDVWWAECGLIYPGLDALHAAGLLSFPEKCRGCREEDRARTAASFEGVPRTWGEARRRGCRRAGRS